MVKSMCYTTDGHSVALEDCSLKTKKGSTITVNPGKPHIVYVYPLDGMVWVASGSYALAFDAGMESAVFAFAFALMPDGGYSLSTLGSNQTERA